VRNRLGSKKWKTKSKKNRRVDFAIGVMNQTVKPVTLAFSSLWSLDWCERKVQKTKKNLCKGTKSGPQILFCFLEKNTLGPTCIVYEVDTMLLLCIGLKLDLVGALCWKICAGFHLTYTVKPPNRHFFSLSSLTVLIQRSFLLTWTLTKQREMKRFSDM
jgi:hypothetical protein